MNFKKERENKLNLYLITIWNEIQGDSENSVFNTVLNKRLGWLQPETDHISEYVAEIGYTEVGLGGEVFLTDRGVIRTKELLGEEKHEDIVELSDIEEEVTNIEEFIDTGWVSTVVSWAKDLFSK